MGARHGLIWGYHTHYIQSTVQILGTDLPEEVTMEWQELIKDGYERVLQALEEVLDGLNENDLNEQPRSDCNSMGWLAWHLTRVQDDHIADLIGEKQLWIRDGWHAKFNRPSNPKDLGFGHSPEDVAAFKSPNVNTLLDYHRAVLQRTKQYITALTSEDLDRELNEPWFRLLPTVGVRLISILSDDLQHVGQMAYVRGLLKGKGWLNY